jgi:tetratricopeptide (TPR) repeat protein
MLWYQIEPILAYKELGNYDKVFTITENILENGNRAFSELYLIRGDIYLEQGNLEAAKDQYEKAVFYNKNLVEAKEKLESL